MCSVDLISLLAVEYLVVQCALSVCVCVCVCVHVHVRKLYIMMLFLSFTLKTHFVALYLKINSYI